MLGMVAAKSDKLLADGTATICLALAAFCVLNNTLHLLAGRERAVGIAALACMDQRLNAALYAKTTRVSWALGSCCSLVVAVIIKSKSKLIHLVLMTFNIVTGNAQVIVLAHSAVVARLHVVLTLIAGVDEAVLALVVQLHQHTHGAPLGPP